MPIIDESVFKNQIKSLQFSKAYFIYGNESFTKEKFVKLLKSKIVPKGKEFFNLHSFDWTECDVDTIAESVDTLPIGCEKTCVIIKNLNIENIQSNENKKLRELLSDLPSTCVLIFWQSDIEVLPKKSSKWKTFISNFSKNGDVLEINTRTESTLNKLIIDECAKRNCKIEKRIAQYFLSIAGSNLQNLNNEIEKVCNYIKSGEIKISDIDDVVIKDDVANVFELSRAIISGQSDKSLSIVNNLILDKQEPISILYIITSAFVDVYRVKISSIAGGKHEQISEVYNYKGKEFLLRNASYNANKLSVLQIRLCLETLYNADVSLKSSRIDKKIVLEETIVKLLRIVKN